MAVSSELDRLLDSLDRLRAHVEAVRALSPTARDDIATVLHVLVGGDGGADGYGLVVRAFNELGLDMPEAAGRSADIPETIEGEPVLLGMRGTPTGERAMPLLDHLDETCLRFAVPGFEPMANWSYLDFVRKARNKFGSHVDKRPPKWLEELRFYPAGDADALTFLLWRAAEVTLTAVTDALVAAGVDAESYEPGDCYLNGIDLEQAYVLGRPGQPLDVRARVRCATWASGSRRPLVGALFDDEPFVFGLEADSRLTFTLGSRGQSVGELTQDFRLQGLPKVGRNAPCPCESGRKFKHCHGR